MQESCEGCGQCCKQGGPALHHDDLELVRSGKIPMSSLITIRKGELVTNPLIGGIQPVAVELVKISGSGRQWDCCYYSGTKGCTIYEERPQACRALKCWNTEEILALIEKDTLSRTDILPEDHLLLPIIREHERIFPCSDLQQVYNKRQKISQAMKNELETRANDEMRFRMRIVEKFQLKLCDELFCFGRPIFQLLQALGVRVSESASTEIRLHWDR
ncbi:MAG: YkgJ family cysteine cluster protein [Pseudomonadota bacterium]